MRGTLDRQSDGTRRTRFIPAYAGNASLSVCKGSQGPVHPRVCGERTAAVRLSDVGTGSSPRMRGTHIGGNWSDSCFRFIPAYAGNAFGQNLFPILPTVHPRVCGERKPIDRNGSFGCGSSPRMRGTRVDRLSVLGCCRFIPAYAGNAVCGMTLVLSTPVHPRVCGERPSGYSVSARFVGSSPRMRGTLVRGGSDAAGGRFIPAYAGNAPPRDSAVLSRSVHPRVCGERQ